MTPETAAAMVRIGERLKQRRKMAGLSLREAAPLLGISAMAPSKWERGQVALTSEHLIRAGRAYGCKASDLMYVKPKVELTMAHWHKEERT
jgi:transcriptional regulator with XRE-family HTH domain